MASRVHVRKGPPEAVRVSRSTRPGWLRTWKMALGSESTGSNFAPLSAAAFNISGPAQIRHSLLAIAISAPRRTAAIVGANPAAPVSYTHLRAHETPEHLV